jgi:hypothetical protein
LRRWKFDPLLERRLWVAKFDAGRHFSIIPVGVAVDPGDGVYVAVAVSILHRLRRRFLAIKYSQSTGVPGTRAIDLRPPGQCK